MRLRLAIGLVACCALAGAVGTPRSLNANGMMIRTTIGLEGLMALVRSPAFDRASVVAVDATRATLRHDLPAHEPILTIPIAAVKKGTPDTFADTDRRIGVWRLKNHHVAFRSAASGPLRPVRTAGDSTYPRSAAEWRDVKWLIDMERLVGDGRGTIRNELMMRADLRESIVATRIDLGAGTIEATEPPEPWNGGEQRFLPLQGLTTRPVIQQATTHRLVYTPDASGTFGIVLTSFDGSMTREIELAPGADVTPITISNHTTSPNLIGAHHEQPSQAVHFLAFYDLLATGVPSTPLMPSALVPFPNVRTSASPGAFCPGDWPLLTWSFDR